MSAPPARLEKPVLQVALDFVDLDRALQVVEEALRGGADWIEVGTPLIKSEGMRSIRAFRQRYPDKVIAADMKTMDVGKLEVEMATKAGASVVVILGVADDSTVKEAVRAGRKYGARVMVDIMNVQQMVERAVRLEKLGVDYVCVHVGIDQQMRGMDPIEILKDVSKRVKVPLAVAGGINSELAARAVRAGASIVVVGGAITKAPNAEEAARAIKEAMITAKPVKTELYKKYGPSEVLEALRKVSTANVSDAMHRSGQMEGIRSIVPGLKIVGRAITVRVYPGDWAKAIEAITAARKGDVIVIDAGGSKEAVWGELAGHNCKLKGIAGAIIDGAVRDVEEIARIRFPVFARHVSPTAGEPKGMGEINVEIVCGNQKVKPGDYIVGDDDGVVVIPQEEAVEIANRAVDIMEQEGRIREEIRRGRGLAHILHLELWEKLGLVKKSS